MNYTHNRRVRRAIISTCIEEESDHIDAAVTESSGCLMQRRHGSAAPVRIRSPVKKRTG